MDWPAAWPLLLIAAFAAGVLNAVAGGGSFLTFPALVYAGVPPIVANATSALAVSPGYLGSTLGFRPELRALPSRRLIREAIIAAIGGVGGALLLLLTPAPLFAGIVPWLLLLATVLFAVGPWLARKAAVQKPAGEGQASHWLRDAGLFIVAVYGGYFNGGLGILLMALYTLAGESRITTVNALKNLNSLVLSWLSVAAFVVAGAVAWAPGLLMMVGATAGGYFGAKWSRRLPVVAVRAVVIITGVVMTVVFFARR
ncbi:sulfite exporter TauE/SafE family protein [Hydrogenophaga sp. 5NK40-0174]|uniref:sulfite exporter TauE/SafE family protein n=1 Tax=Hydrogenophaga sp. 5NK40-0174 TaxID=3127649 RepID=UPI0031069A71